MKENNHNYPTTVRWTHNEMIQLQLRAGALGMVRSEYIRVKSLEPIDKLKKAQEQENADRLKYETYIQIRGELNHQEASLNQMARAINFAGLESESVKLLLESIATIKKTNEAILQAVAHLGGSDDWQDN